MDASNTHAPRMQEFTREAVAQGPVYKISR